MGKKKEKKKAEEKGKQQRDLKGGTQGRIWEGKKVIERHGGEKSVEGA